MSRDRVTAAPHNAGEREFWDRAIVAYISGAAGIERSDTARHVLGSAQAVAAEALDARREVFAEGRRQEREQREADEQRNADVFAGAPTEKDVDHA